MNFKDKKGLGIGLIYGLFVTLPITVIGHALLCNKNKKEDEKMKKCDFPDKIEPLDIK
jgi:hypothetical protein